MSSPDTPSSDGSISSPAAPGSSDGSVSSPAAPGSSDGSVSSPAAPGGGSVGSPGSSGGSVGSPGATRLPAPDGNSVPGVPPSINVGPGGLPGSDPAQVAPTSWLTYTNTQSGFSIAYPDTYTYTDTPRPGMTAPAGQVVWVIFLDRQLARSDTAALQPPMLSVEAYSKPADLTFEQWIERDMFSPGQRDEVTLAGRNGYRVTLQIELAPNQFYYVAGDNYYYKLTPLGQYGEQMVQSFTLR